ncbi:hypothetical protein THAOC_26543 [Thalassiosira oceanica]|uniref:Calmodulin-lysine N-methyltransferase n=1 Tax=Thalassiosira oceanica TaxID=159749 RepID=K0S4U5_THAOC|nr:hypothetical protein THAOC_26543 [Thalassiosira oceanica]|eukprot:EJK53927.1 hypothetical protein THAOC_26543 [Thalassiosira oceanica]
MAANLQADNRSGADTDEQAWIESPDGWGDDDEGQAEGYVDLFGGSDPRQSFDFNVKGDGGASKTIRLKGFKLDSNETAQSTGVTMWKATPRLVDFLQSSPELCKGRSVLELGAGLGLVGITAQLQGAESVVMTDGDSQTLAQMRLNVKENCSADECKSISCRQLLWGSPQMDMFEKQCGRFATILGADVIYTLESVAPLFDTVACLLDKPRGKFVLARYNKWNDVENDSIFEVARRRCLKVDTTESEGIYIFTWDD